jgi:hypothetical protein
MESGMDADSDRTMGFRAYGESLPIYGADDAVNAGSGIYAYALNENRVECDAVVGFRAW